MKTPEQWHHTITDAESSAFGGPGWMLRFIAAIQSDAIEGMVPAAELRPIIVILKQVDDFCAGARSSIPRHDITDAIACLETLQKELQAHSK